MDAERPRPNANCAQHEQEFSSSPRRDHSGNEHTRDDLRPKRDLSHIQGWGADLDHKRRPAYPMERAPSWPNVVDSSRPEDQPLNAKIYHSTERPGIPPVFGTSTPPGGVSGQIRDVAYKFSENDIRHWLLLLFADRVNVVEGIGADLKRGRVPNVFAEMGGRAEWKYNRAGLVRKVALASAMAGIAYLVIRRGKKRIERHGLERISRDL